MSLRAMPYLGVYRAVRFIVVWRLLFLVVSGLCLFGGLALYCIELCRVVSCRVVSCRLVWSGMVWYGLVWSGVIWPGLVWSGLVWSGSGLV